MMWAVAAALFPILAECSGGPPPSPPPLPVAVDTLVRLNPGGYDSGLCLDYAHDEYGLRDGLPIILNSCDTAPKWNLYTKGFSGHGIQIPNSNFCVDVPGNDQTNGNFLWLWTCGATDESFDAQRWYARELEESRGFKSWYLVLASSQTPVSWMCMDAVYDDGYVAGAPVQLWDCLNPTTGGETTDQDWWFDDAGDDEFADALM